MAKVTDNKSPENTLKPSDLLNAYEDQSIVNLGIGRPDTNILMNCCAMFEEATLHRMKIEAFNEAQLFDYGPSAGNLEICTEISTFLTNVYKSRVDRDNIFITNGASRGIHLIISALLDLSGYVFVDEITYLFALEIFKEFTNLIILPVKLHEDGVDIELLRKLLQKNKFKSNSKCYWGLYYTMPIYHNPTGIIFSNDVCNNLITLAREFNILVLCDDVYNALYYNDAPPKRLFAYDNPSDSNFKGNVISNGTFSKIIAPGLRFGWLEVHPECKAILEGSGVLQSGGCLNNYMAGIIASALQLGLVQSHVKMMKALHHERMLLILDVLKMNLPKSCHFLRPMGGYYIWIRLPKNIDATELLKICLVEYKVFFFTGHQFSLENKCKNCIRISIGNYAKEDLKISVLKICKCISDFLNKCHLI